MLNLSQEGREKGDFSIWPSQLGLELARPAQFEKIDIVKKSIFCKILTKTYWWAMSIIFLT